MANRVPLIVDTSTLYIKELPVGDNLDLTGSGIVGLSGVGGTAANFTGIVTASAYYVDSTEVISNSREIKNATSLQVGVGGSIITTTNTPRVGINSTSPAYTLDIGGDLNFSGALYQGGAPFTSGVGIQSGGVIIGTGVTSLNFIGVGNTFQYNIGTNTVDISISGGGTEEVTAVSSVSATAVLIFDATAYRSASVLAQITQGTDYQVGRYLLIHDGTTVTVIEESAIATASMLGSFSGAISGSNVEFRVTMNSASAATIVVKSDKISI